MRYNPLATDGYQAIVQRHHVGTLLAKMIAGQGLTDDQTASFLNAPSVIGLQAAPCLDQAFEELENLRREGARVFIFGDYDCDGLCGTALMYRALTSFGLQCGYYVPNRRTEGYGLNQERLSQAYAKGYRALVTVDNGVSAAGPLGWARQHGMRSIVTDHHVIAQDVDCDVLIHPSRLGGDESWLCGTGVALALAQRLGVRDEIDDVLAMVATIGDVMELQGQNVAIVREGLQSFNQGRFPNFTALADAARLPMTAEDVAFRIVPRLNAVGRMADVADPNKVVAFLLSHDQAQIEGYARQIEQLNVMRQRMTAEQLPLLQAMPVPVEGIAVYYHPDLHEGLLGLMAGRLASDLGRPVIVLTVTDGAVRGSGRSQPGYDITQALTGFKDRLTAFGGHQQACGLAMPTEQLEPFMRFAASRPVAGLRQPAQGYVSLTMSDLTYDNLSELMSQQPLGQGRRLPLVGVTIGPGCDFRMLRNEHQLKWTMDLDRGRLAVLSFRDNEGFQAYQDYGALNAIGQLRANVYKGRVGYDLMSEIIEKR